MAKKMLWSLVALAAVLGVTASASGTVRGLITGNQIKDHTISSRHLIDHTIQAHDLSADLVRSLQGKPGPEGPQGEPGQPAHHAFISMNADGSVAVSGGVDIKAPGGTGKVSGSTGVYFVLFDQDIRQCVAVANLATGAAPVGYATLSHASFYQIGVHTFNSAGLPADSPFWLVLVC